MTMWTVRPPALATWLLQHFTFGEVDEALAGDLLEELRSGRSAGWYWGQVLAAISVSWRRDAISCSSACSFAALWAILTPSWLLVVSQLEQKFHFHAHIWRMDWPWSTILDLGALLLANLAYILAGIALFLLADLWLRRNLHTAAFLRGMRASLPVMVALSAALIILPMRFLAEERSTNLLAEIPVGASIITHIHPIEVARIPPQETWEAQFGEKPVANRPSPLAAISDRREPAILVRLPFFLVILLALRGARSNLGRRQLDAQDRA